MTATITYGTTSITPELVLAPYSTSVDTGVTVHRIIGRDDPDITFGSRGTRAGSLDLFFLTTFDQEAAFTLLSSRGSFILMAHTSAESYLDMTFVVGPGSLSKRVQHTAAGERWVVTMPYTEVVA